MKVILVDDEKIALEVLARELSVFEDVEIVGSYTSPYDALNNLKTLNADVIFLDIQMGRVNGLEMGELFLDKDSRLEIVFVTAYSQYAVKAFELNAIDYLLKPVQRVRLKKCIQRLRDKLVDKNEPIEKDKLKINSFGAFEALNSEGKRLKWRTQKGKELFAYLWVEGGRPVAKDQILENIFSYRKLDEATTLLHTTVYQLRKNLEKLGYEDSILYFNDSYQLKIPTTSDLEDLLDIVKKKKYNDNDIIKILELYKGNFLETEGYHWAIAIEERYRDIVVNSINIYLSQRLRERSESLLVEMSLDFAYDLDPFNEDIIGQTIGYYGKRNRQNELKKFFRMYKKNLYKELEEKPPQQIKSLFEKYTGYEKETI